MEVNGSADIKGSVATEPEFAVTFSANGTDAENYEGFIKFSNGIKINFGTFSASGNGTTAETMPSAYTEGHYAVIGCYADDVIATDAGEASTMFFVPNTNQLSQVRCMNASNAAAEVTYISIGKDS